MTSQVEWLSGLDEAALTRLLDVRSDVSIDPPPRTFDALAHLLLTRNSVARAVRGLDRGASSVLAALKDNRTRADLGARFDEGGTTTTADLERALTLLIECGLAWPSGSGYKISPLYGATLAEVPSLARPWPGEALVTDPTTQQRAVARFCETADAVLAAVESGRVSTVKAGGIGAREIRALSKLVDAEHSSVVELVLELAGAMGLLDVYGDKVRGTTELPTWLASSRAEKMSSMIGEWWRVGGSPTNRTFSKVKAPPVLGLYMQDPSTTALRHAVVRSMPERGIANAEKALEFFEWTLPGFVDAANTGDLQAILQEAAWLGVFAGHSPTELSRALGRGENFVPFVASIVDRSDCTLRLLPDLTAVVTGPVSERMSAVLTASADSESKDAASTWRFRPTSVRRFLDGGGTAEDLLAELADLASTDVPQSLDYLIRDCARRHGNLLVRTAASVVVGQDESLVREIAALDALKGTIVAPTVLVSTLPARRMLDLLRDAGYSPMAEGSAAQVKVSRAQARTMGSAPLVTTRVGTDPAVLATALASGTPVEIDVDRVKTIIRAWCRLASREVDVLARAVAFGEGIRIDYVDRKRGPKSDEMSDVILDSGVVHGWSAGGNGWRSIELAHIRTVAEIRA